MIALASDCLYFAMANGQSYPCSAEMISIELMGDSARLFDAEFLRHVAHAVFHYFKVDLERKTVTVAEFAAAPEKALRGFALSGRTASMTPDPQTVEWDLCRLACESGKGCELFFFPRLRQELGRQMLAGPRVFRFRGLRRCVKQLVGARRWTPRCQVLKEEILHYLRHCLSTQPSQTEVAMVVV
jgi:hypothetical protein